MNSALYQNLFNLLTSKGLLTISETVDAIDPTWPNGGVGVTFPSKLPNFEDGTAKADEALPVLLANGYAVGRPSEDTLVVAPYYWFASK